MIIRINVLYVFSVIYIYVLYILLYCYNALPVASTCPAVLVLLFNSDGGCQVSEGEAYTRLVQCSTHAYSEGSVV